MNALIEAFLEMIGVERGAARNTLDAYRRDLTDFASFLTVRGLEAGAADHKDIEAFALDLSVRGLSSTTIASGGVLPNIHVFLIPTKKEGEKAE